MAREIFALFGGDVRRDPAGAARCSGLTASAWRSLTGAAGGLGAPRRAHCCMRRGAPRDRDRPRRLPGLRRDDRHRPVRRCRAGRACATVLRADPPDILGQHCRGSCGSACTRPSRSRPWRCATGSTCWFPRRWSRAVAGPMRARGHGQIVNIGSVLGAIPYPWFAAYSSSKAGLAALSQALRRELGGQRRDRHPHQSARRDDRRSTMARSIASSRLTGMKADEPGLGCRAHRRGDRRARDHARISARWSASTPRSMRLPRA